MAEQIINVNCGFFDAIDNDRRYSADEMNMPYKRLVADGVFATPTGTPSTDLQVVFPTGLIALAVTVKRGNAIIGSKWFENSADTGVSVPPNTGIYTRIDSVIAQVDTRTAGRVGNIVYRTGTASSTPTPPAINEISGVYELRLANIEVAPGATTLTGSEITDCRGSSECPWVTALIQQVDTSQLYNQWQTAYQTYFDNTEHTVDTFIDEQEAAWQAFFNAATHNFTVISYFRYTSSYTTTGASTTNIPIGIPSFDSYTDILSVYINGLMAAEGIRFTLNANKTSIDLVSALPAGQTVYFEVFHAVQPTDVETAIAMINRLQQDDIAPMKSDITNLQGDVSALQTTVGGLTSDTGWVTAQLDGYTAADTAPAYRKRDHTVYFRGAIKCISGIGKNYRSDPFFTLPEALRPSAVHYFIGFNIKSDADPSSETASNPNPIPLKVDTNGNVSICGLTAGDSLTLGASGTSWILTLSTSFVV